jgi:hypothetical protein
MTRSQHAKRYFGDGDIGSCGWLSENVGYSCSGAGEGPNGFPFACPEGLVANEPCGEVSWYGCCDTNGALWYCNGEVLESDPCLD